MKKGAIGPLPYSHGAFDTLIGIFGSSPNAVYDLSGTTTVFLVTRTSRPRTR